MLFFFICSNVEGTIHQEIEFTRSDLTIYFCIFVFAFLINVTIGLLDLPINVTITLSTMTLVLNINLLCFWSEDKKTEYLNLSQETTQILLSLEIIQSSLIDLVFLISNLNSGNFTKLLNKLIYYTKNRLNMNDLD
ncbi:MAG: hypothetical protein ACK5XN_01920, partial [Bacteroidota bacterium]